MPRQKSTHVDSAAAVGRRVREVRERLGLRQSDLAFPGCTAAYVSRIEAGTRIPSLQVLREIGKRLRVSADYLANDAGVSVDALLLTDTRLAQCLGDYDMARSGFSRLAESDESELRRAGLLGLSQLALEDGEIERGIEFLEEHEQLGGHEVEPLAIEALAHAYSTRGDSAGALALLERTIERAENGPLARFRLTVTLANVLIDLGQFDRAETIIDDSIAELGASPNPITLARCLWSESRLQAACGNNELAANYAQQALTLIQSTEHEEYVARAHHLLAYIKLERGQPQRAIELLDEAMPLVERGGDQPLNALFRLERARALADLGEVEDAQALATELVLEVEQLSKVDAARSLAVLASIFTRIGDTDRALELYEAAADAVADRPNAPMLVDLYTRWSDLLAEVGQTEQALQVARRALSARTESKR